MNNKQALVVTTEHRGVFFGYGEVTEKKIIRLENARMCVYWPQENHGVLGLASDGPKAGARITPCIPAILIQGVTSIMETTREAETEWNK